jgi:hypothetical protein
MANTKTVVVEKEKPHKSTKSTNVDEPAQTPEPIGESQVGQPTNADDLAESGKVPVNQAGQKLDEPLTGEEDAYVTQDGRIMIVQMEEADSIFAGEHGRNAQWYPKEILNSWTKKTK